MVRQPVRQSVNRLSSKWCVNREGLLVTPDSWVIDPLLESALIVWEALCAAPETKLFAEVVPPLATDTTLSTGNADLKGYPITDPEARHLGTDGHYFASGFVAQR